ncbi:MAG: ATP-binding cassette domain-containing protein [Verrucomicrobiota bacterium]
MIEAKHLIKDYGSFRAVNDISFELKKGDVLGFLGPNGAGKSTTMKMVTGFLSPTGGEVTIGGINIAENPIEAKKRFGYLPENCPLYYEMTVIEFLESIADFRNLEGSDRADRIAHVIEVCHLDAVRYRTIDTLSKGYRQRVGMAQAIIHEPDYLIMDEPTDGLDPNQKQEVRKLVASMSKDKAIILSTHILEEVESMCNRVIVVDKGKILVDESPQKFRERHPYHNALEVVFDSAIRKEASEAIKGIDEVKEVKEEKDKLFILPKNGGEIDGLILEKVQAKNWKVQSFNKAPTRLDQVFRNLTEASSKS